MSVDPEVLDFHDEEVVTCMVAKYGYDETSALAVFLNAQTYRMLANPAMEMWQFGPMGIFDMWESEKVTGTPQRSAYLRML